MIPLIPPGNHLDLARELTTPRKQTQVDDFDAVSSRRHELAPDPIYLAMNRFWTKVTDLLVSGFRKAV